MTFEQLPNLIGISVPLITIAGTAIAYTFRIIGEARRERRDAFFKLANLLDERGTITSKMVAVYELRNFPEHREFIVRYLEANLNNIQGDASSVLRSEFTETLRFFEAENFQE